MMPVGERGPGVRSPTLHIVIGSTILDRAAPIYPIQRLAILIATARDLTAQHRWNTALTGQTPH